MIKPVASGSNINDSKQLISWNCKLIDFFFYSKQLCNKKHFIQSDNKELFTDTRKIRFTQYYCEKMPRCLTLFKGDANMQMHMSFCVEKVKSA